MSDAVHRCRTDSPCASRWRSRRLGYEGHALTSPYVQRLPRNIREHAAGESDGRRGAEPMGQIVEARSGRGRRRTAQGTGRYGCMTRLMFCSRRTIRLESGRRRYLRGSERRESEATVDGWAVAGVSSLASRWRPVLSEGAQAPCAMPGRSSHPSRRYWNAKFSGT